MNRRKFIQGAGFISVLVAGGTVWRAIDQGVFSSGEGQAYQEWKNWDKNPSTGLLSLVQSAILAASPHNTQPWLFKISDSSIDLYVDLKRNIGAIDPLLRELHMGVGCALENLLLAAKAYGYSYQLDYFPNSSDLTHVVNIRLRKDETVSSALYHAIPRRHTNRGPHDMTNTVPINALNTLSMLGEQFTKVKVVWIEDENHRDSFFDLNTKATKELINDQEQSKASFRWLRNSWQELQAKKDGVSIDTTGISPVMRAIAKIIPPVSRESGDQYFFDAMKNLKNVTDRVGIIVAKNNSDNTQRMQGGRYWQRMHLWGTTQGLAMQPVNQVPERIDRAHSLGEESIFNSELQRLIGESHWQALMPFRIGNPQQEALKSPRRFVSEVII